MSLSREPNDCAGSGGLGVVSTAAVFLGSAIPPRSDLLHSGVNVGFKNLHPHRLSATSVVGNKHNPVTAIELGRALNKHGTVSPVHFNPSRTIVGATSPRKCGGGLNICESGVKKQLISDEIESGADR